MRRIALSLSIVFAGSLMGCQEAQPTAEPLQSTDVGYPSLQPDLYVTGNGETQAYQPAAPYRSYQEPARADTSYPAYDGRPSEMSLTASSTLMHSVATGDTLFSLARHYYNDASRWKDIYEANRNTLKSPDLLLVGQELEIPQ